METVELHSAEAATWVWEALWSARHHIRMDILDVALLDRLPHPAALTTTTTPNIAQWLFTAKDGRIMKKSSSNASLAALKQALLGKTIRRAAFSDREICRDSKRGISGAATVHRPLATALLSTGKCVLVDEYSWRSVLLDGVVHEEGGGEVIAITALDPGDSLEIRRGPRQRLMGEYRVKSDYTLSSSAGGEEAFGAPAHAITKTYMLVASDLLRGADGVVGGQKTHAQSGGLRTTMELATKRTPNSLLVSKAAATNKEVETKLRRIVQWVQEVRRVRILDMTALFIALPSSGTGAPGVWLERVTSARVVRSEIPLPAPSAEMGTTTSPRTVHDPRNSPTTRVVDPTDVSPRNPQGLRGMWIQPIETQQKSISSLDENVRIGVGGGEGQGSSSKIDHIDDMTTSSCNDKIADCGTNKDDASTPVPSCTHRAPPHRASVSEMLADAARSALSSGTTGEGATTDVVCTVRTTGGHTNDAGGSPTSIAATPFQPTSATSPAEAVRASYRERRCAGDFCTCNVGLLAPMKQQSPKQAAENSEDEGALDGDGCSGVDWTGIGLACEGDALLKIGKRKTQSLPTNLGVSHNDLRLSIAKKSICLARMDASEGDDAHWGKDLRTFWKSRDTKATGGLEELNPSLFHEEALVCRACYDIYRKLDNSRRDGSRASRRESGSSKLNVSSGTSSSNTRSPQRLAAAEAGAARLSADLTAMLKDVDARSGKLGIEAGIIWRRRLNKSKSSSGVEFATERSQIRLADRLARPKLRSQSKEGAAIPAHGKKRQVKSQGKNPGNTNNGKYRRRDSAPADLPSLPSLQSAAAPKSSVVFGGRDSAARVDRSPLPPGLPRRNAWATRDETADSMTGKSSTRSAAAASPTAIPERLNKPTTSSLQESDFTNETGGTQHSRQRVIERDRSGGDQIGRGRSGDTIRAIEAMLKGGGERYLPEHAHDLPEATAVLGPPPVSPRWEPNLGNDNAHGNHRKGGRYGGGKSGRNKTNHAGRKTKVPRNSERRDLHHDPAEDGSNRGGEDGSRERASERLRKQTAMDRFLHPWQRRLEAEKRDKSAETIEEAMMELANERQQRREERRMAAKSEHCRRASRRIALRLGRRRRRYRAARTPGQTARDQRQHLDISHDEIECEGAVPVDEADGSGVVGAAKYSIEQMRDSLGWARKTWLALAKRLGINVQVSRSPNAPAIDTTGEVDDLVSELQQHLAAFEIEVNELGSRLAGGIVASSRTFGESCDAACDTFESEFYRMIERITAASATQYNDMEQSQHAEQTGPQRSAFSRDPAIPNTGTPMSVTGSPIERKSQASQIDKLCPSCMILPVARRCLDCNGDSTDRDRCSSCFVRDHREEHRRDHRFVRVGGSGGGDGGRGTLGRGEERDGTRNSGQCQGGGEKKTDMDPGDVINESHGLGDPALAVAIGGGDDARCSEYGHLVASNRCSPRGEVDTLARSHPLTDGSRRSNSTEIPGEHVPSAHAALQCRQPGQTAMENQPVDVKTAKVTRHDDADAPDVNCKTLSSRIDRPDTATAASSSASPTDTGDNCIENGRGKVGIVGEDSAWAGESVSSTVPSPLTLPLVSSGSPGFTGQPGSCADTGGQSHVGARAVDQRGHASGGATVPSKAGRAGDSESEGGNDAGTTEGKLEQGETDLQDGREVGRSESGAASEEEDDSDDDGMMWSPLNIAKVDVRVSDNEVGSNGASTP